MPITFNSIDDPYGLRSAGGALAQALMQRNLSDRQERSQLGLEERAQGRKIADEQRAFQQTQDRSKKFAEYAPDLAELIGEAPAESLKHMSEQGLVDDPLEFVRVLANARQANIKAGQPGKGPNSVVNNELQKGVGKYLNELQERGSTVNALSQQLGDLEGAIKSPNTAKGFLERLAKQGLVKLGAENVGMSDSEQVINSVTKDVVSNLKQLKGGNFTNARLNLLLGALPAVGKTEEANLAALNTLRKAFGIVGKEVQYANEIVAEANEKGEPIPLDIRKQIQDRIQADLSSFADSLQEGKDNGDVYNSLKEIKGKEGMVVEDEESGKNYIFKNGKWSVTK